MNLIGIDPGETHSGVVLFNTDQRIVRYAEAKRHNEDVLALLRGAHEPVVLETMVPYGLSFGWSTLRTCQMTGRFLEAVVTSARQPCHTITRKQVLEILFGSKPKNPDSAVLQLLQEEIGPKGKKRAPGPTYGVSSHAWQALGAVWAHLKREK